MKESNMIRKATITGITGQDDTYLARLLPDKDYTVCGVCKLIA